MKVSLQNVLNFSLENTLPGSVLILFGIPFLATYSVKNSTTLSVVGFGRIMHLAILSNYRLIRVNTFSSYWHFETVQQILMEIPHLVFSFLVIFQILFGFLCILGSYLLVDTQGKFARAFSTISLCTRGHQTSEASFNIESLPAWPK